MKCRLFPLHCACGRVWLDERKLSSQAEVIRRELELRGVGDVVAKITGWFGYKPCSPCNQRRKWMNRVMPLSIGGWRTAFRGLMKEGLGWLWPKKK